MHTQFAFIKEVDPMIKVPHIEKYDVCIIIKESIHFSDLCIVHFIRENESNIINKKYLQKFSIEKTGDKYDQKICDRCFKIKKTETDFQNNRHKKDNKITKRPSCRECRKEKEGKNITSSQRNIWNKNERPLPYSIFECPICRKTSIAGISRIVLDHNHKTGDVRGWLCESCNTGIGRFDDDPNITRRATEWLRTRDPSSKS